MPIWGVYEYLNTSTCTHVVLPLARIFPFSPQKAVSLQLIQVWRRLKVVLGMAAWTGAEQGDRLDASKKTNYLFYPVGK